MERSTSYSSQGGQHSAGYDNSSQTPPWEQRTVARVPYIGRNAQPLTPAERHALESLWAANEQDQPPLTRPRVHGHGQRSFDQGYPLPRQDRDDAWSLPTPKTAPPFTAVRPPPPPPTATARHSHMIPQAPKSAPHLSSFSAMPPTPPPDNSSLSRSSTKSSSTTKSASRSVSISSPGTSPRLAQHTMSSPRTSPRLPQHTIPSLPGTMSARESVVPPKRSSRPKREERAKKEKSDTAPLGKRFKLAMKDIFKREPIDESQFEHISDRHWADD